MSWRSRARERARASVANRVGDLLTADAAARRLGYEDVEHSGSFRFGADGSRVPIRYMEEEELPADCDRIEYDTLRAFNTGTERGWGVCCTQPVRKGQILGEARGRCIDEAQFAALPDKQCV